jgi:cell division protein FtsW (lipid II flippase)
VHVAYRAHITKSDKSQRKRYNSNIITNLLPFILIIASGVVLLIHGKIGIYLMVAAIVLAFVQMATMSWVLLVIDVYDRRWWHENSDTGANEEK